MGIFKFLKNIGTPEGTRESIRQSYKKHRKIARARPSQDLVPHSVGLYGALATRYRLLGRSTSEVEVWGDLAPFLGMPEPESVDALAEYVVYQEWPNAVNLEWLKAQVNRSLRTEGQHMTLAQVGLANRVRWAALLDPAVVRRINRIAVDLGDDQQVLSEPAHASISKDLKGLDALRHHNRGVTLISAGRNEEALKEFDLAVTSDPALEQAWFNKGNLLFSFGRNEDASACYERAPGLSQAWCNMGAVLRRMARYEAAFKCYEKALSLNPNDKIGWLNRGVVLNKLRNAEEALKSYDRALSVDDEYADAWVNKASLLGQLKRYEEAIKCFDRGLALNPTDSLGWIGKGNVQFDQELWLEALPCYETALRFNRHLEQASIRKGICLRKLQRILPAMRCFDEVLRLNPRSPDAWFEKGLTLMEEATDYGAAKTCFEEAYRLGNESAKSFISACR